MELMVTMAIIVLITGVVVVGVRKVRSSNLRDDAYTLRAALVAAFDRAAATGDNHRLVIDLDAQSYRIERCEGKIKLHRTVDQAAAEEMGKLEAQRKQLLAQDALDAQRNGTAMPQLPGAPGLPGLPASGVAAPKGGALAATCEPAQGPAGRVVNVKKGKGVRISKVHVGHLEKPATDGTVTIHFFSPGYAERAVVEIRDEDDDVFSLVLEPLTGRVRLLKGEYRDAEEHVTEDAEGEEVNAE